MLGISLTLRLTADTRKFKQADDPVIYVYRDQGTYVRADAGEARKRDLPLRKSFMRYYFHLREEGRYLLDEEGLELMALDAARQAAVEGARSIIADEVLLGNLPLRAILEVADEDGNCLFQLPFKDAVQLDG